MADPFTISTIDRFTIVELRMPSLMDPGAISDLGTSLYKLVDEQDRRKIILDFEKVEYISSQTVGILIGMQKKLAALPHGQLILCGVGPKLTELLRIMRLDKKLTIKPTQKEAIKTALT
jgi:anti-sigma B factor antagonist